VPKIPQAKDSDSITLSAFDIGCQFYPMLIENVLVLLIFSLACFYCMYLNKGLDRLCARS